MKTTMISLMIGVATLAACGADAAETDKTLVSWVILADKNVTGGSVLTIQNGSQFDGIVFAELQPGRWMSGSDGFGRTEEEQSAYPTETADSKTLVQIAIVYKDDHVFIYRNGELYASHKAENIDLLSSKDNVVLFGLRRLGHCRDGNISGSIEDARIYARALSVDEIKSLEPNKASTIKPYAWWDFEGDKVVDRAGRYTHIIKRMGGPAAKLADGRLVLFERAALRVTGPYQPETPQWPENPPENWMTYHLAHPGPGNAWPADPNTAFYYEGRYHLHYIYHNRTGYAFAHVSSKDMVHWKWHPTVLAPTIVGHGMFSGTGFFTKQGKPAIIYNGQGSGRIWIQYALDDQLDSWSKPEIVLPRTADGKVRNIGGTDPDCWRIGETYYAMTGAGNPQLMKSRDLENWTYLGDVLHEDYPADLGVPKGEDISCANMFKIGRKWMLLCISHRLGCRYYLGDFKDEKFLPDFHAMMSWNGVHFFAPESLLAKDGRRVMWAWVMHGRLTSPSGIQSLPRELELPDDGVLRIKLLRELETLRYDRKQEKKLTVKNNSTHVLEHMAGDALELKVEFKAPTAKEFGVDVLCDEDGQNGLRIAVIAENKTLKIGTGNTPVVLCDRGCCKLDRIIHSPFELKQGEDLTLRVFIDRNLVEVFANDRQAVAVAFEKCHTLANTRLFTQGSDLQVNEVTAWKMKPIHEGDCH